MAQIVTYSRTNFVERHRGTMPIILTCPHDGGEAPPGVAERSAGDYATNCKFKTGRDVGTAVITKAVASHILRRTGLTPYVVIATFARKYVDANRAADCAFKDPDAEVVYDEYHRRIRQYSSQILTETQNTGLLVDIHGTPVLDSDPADIYLGTANGGSLQPGFPRSTLFQRSGLNTLLAAVRREDEASTGGGGAVLRYRVSPVNSTVAETGVVNGGYTIRHYGPSINSVQVEIATTATTGELSAFVASDLAWAIVNFTRRHVAAF